MFKPLMSLRFRLNLFITLLFALVFVSGSIYVIHNARKAVSDEVRATAYLTLQLVNIALINVDSGQPGQQSGVLEKIAALESTRHLDIEIYRADDPARTAADRADAGAIPITAEAPKWFIQLVKPEPMEFRHVVNEPGIPYTEILIKADPSDEITEVWGESRGVLGLLVVFVLLANMLVYITLGRGLAPLETILQGLEGIEQGDYKLRLPQFNLPELARISEKFNHMAEVLNRSREQNRYLTQRSLAIQEDERRKLAYELHDELGQSITAIKAVAASIEKHADKDAAAINESAETIISVSNRMYDAARNMMRRLRPPSLDELGLVTTLQDMIDDWNARHQDIFCYFSFEGDMEQLNEEINISLYRIVQEGLTNIVKHSQAGTVKISLSVNKAPSSDVKNSHHSHVILIMEDDGRGFDAGSVRPGLGLLGMRERAEALNGKFSAVSRPGKGVSIRILIPL
jgi:two-component system sensor histidine kinase UhpB